MMTFCHLFSFAALVILFLQTPEASLSGFVIITLKARARRDAIAWCFATDVTSFYLLKFWLTAIYGSLRRLNIN